MHRLLAAPTRRLENKIRLPLLQPVGENIARNLTDTLMDNDSLRRVKTTGQRTMLGPLPAVQEFTMSGPGHPNTEPSMRNGLRISNSPRIVNKTRGQSAGA